MTRTSAAVENHLKRTLSASDAHSKFETYKQRVNGANLSNREARAVAKEIVGGEIQWDWDLPRTKEGYYHYRGGMGVRSAFFPDPRPQTHSVSMQAAMKRTLAFADYADLLWLETKAPDLKQAQTFAGTIRAENPGKWLVYNLSPSFNWGAHGFTNEQLKSFVWDLGKAGFVIQLISLAGLHSTAVTTGASANAVTVDVAFAY